MGDVLRMAVLEEESLRANLSRIEEARRVTLIRLHEVRSFIATWHELSGSQPPVFGDVAQPSKGPPKAKNPMGRAVVARKCAEIIREAGHAMKARELHVRIESAGIMLNGGNTLKVLNTMLWRSKDIVVHLKGLGYWPADLPHKACGYVPASGRSEPGSMEQR